MSGLERSGINLSTASPQAVKQPSAEVEICFMAISFEDDALTRSPTRIYLSYGMLAQPYITSDPLFVHTGVIPVTTGPHPLRTPHARSASMPVRGPAADARLEDVCWPGILWTLEDDRRPAYNNPPGCVHTFRAKTSVCEAYMLSAQVTIDIFDADTHHMIGSCGVTLRGVSTPGLVAGGSVEIVRRPDGGVVSGTSPAAAPIGKLYLRVAHVGRSAEILGGEVGRQPYLPGVMWPRKMIDVDPELRALIQSTLQDSVSIKESNPEAYRKVEQVRRIKAVSGFSPPDFATGPVTYSQTRSQQLATLHTTQTVRTRALQPSVRRHLTSSATVHVPVHAIFGHAYCVPFVAKNPYTTAATFVISWTDADVRAVMPDGAEAAYLARQHSSEVRWNKGGASTIVESADDRVKVFLNAAEDCFVPFMFQSFLPGGEGARTTVARDIVLTFACAKSGTILSLLNLEIIPTPFYSTQHARIYVAEKEVVRHVMRGNVDTSSGRAGGRTAIFDMARPGKLYVRCHDPDVVCEIVENTNTNLQTLTFKHTTRPAPSIHTLYFLLYNDPYHTTVCEIWRCVVHSLIPVHVSGTLGQPTNASVVVRGGSCSRAVGCWVDCPDIATVMRLSPMVLTANSLNEIPLLVRPKIVGTQQLILNVVDVDTTRLHSSYLLHLHTSAPPITKSFTLTLPRSTTQSKRISYTNPYARNKTFRLHTPTPHLLAFVHNTLDLGPGETVYIGLRLLAWSGDERVVDVMVMLNDEEERVEECLGLRIMYE
ncbi:Nephrocystin-4 [Thoreauomyces humboldtii]|nr:Nephrocystin-4 [Thoreauomyces humboldtii]